jgi:ATP-binding protein involved in chromosome partitioning
MSNDDTAFVPTQIRQADARHLAISWADGHESLYEVRALRLACRCAQCVDEWSGTPTLDTATVAEDIQPKNLASVGRYAIRIDWSDGHDTGIYSFRRLRELDDSGA